MQEYLRLLLQRFFLKISEKEKILNFSSDKHLINRSYMSYYITQCYVVF